ncbi:MAG: bifunctional demethylmenaquinone methyltransferase/2-methoxy-6-polyprenyl-1,4-benzoquinol methylase UbiE [Verrucomicrobiia bacterium]
MESKFYQADEHRAEKVQELFATIARRYDRLNDIMSAGLHRRWKRRLVELALGKAEGGKQMRVLDLCCGTGDIALAFARAGADVTGADFTEEMLQVARTRAGRARVRWVRADALQLPFPDSSFDVVSVGYGLRNLADIERGLDEILRVLKPGGKFLSLDFGKPESRVFRALYFGYLRVVLPILGRMFCGDPDTYGYILASLQNYPAQRGIEELMETCGYRECGFEEFCLGSMAINYGVKPG